MSYHGAMNRQTQIIRTSAGSIVCNLALSGIKFSVGAASHSQAVMTDAANNLGDAMGSAVTIIGTRLSRKRPDRTHPFGYGRIEYLTSAIVSFIVVYVGIEAFTDSLSSLLHPGEVTFTDLSLWLLAISLAVKMLLGAWLRRRGKTLRSASLTATAADSISDSVLSLATLLSALLNRFTGVELGGWLGLVISLFIIKSGVDLILAPLNELVGERSDTALTDAVKETIAGFEGVCGVYDLILNTYGDSACIGSVHIQVPDTMTAPEIQGLTRKISRQISRQYQIILTIGIYASNDTDPVSARILASVKQILADYPGLIQMHGFYVDLQAQVIAFDLIFDFTADAVKCRHEIRDRIRAEYPDYTVDIILDKDYSD